MKFLSYLCFGKGISKMNDSGIGWIIGLFIIVGIIGAALYLITLAAAIVIPIGGAAGVAWGGGAAIKNYFSSFKENVFDSNKKNKV